jgi:hypothetical protein
MPNFTVPVLHTSLIDLLEKDYCIKVQLFLEQNGLSALIDDSIAQMHQRFIETNTPNIILAKKLLAHDFWQPRHVLDEILFTGIIEYGF